MFSILSSSSFGMITSFSYVSFRMDWETSRIIIEKWLFCIDFLNGTTITWIFWFLIFISSNLTPESQLYQLLRLYIPSIRKKTALWLIYFDKISSCSRNVADNRDIFFHQVVDKSTFADIWSTYYWNSYAFLCILKFLWRFNDLSQRLQNYPWLLFCVLV